MSNLQSIQNHFRSLSHLKALEPLCVCLIEIKSSEATVGREYIIINLLKITEMNTDKSQKIDSIEYNIKHTFVKFFCIEIRNYHWNDNKCGNEFFIFGWFAIKYLLNHDDVKTNAIKQIKNIFRWKVEQWWWWRFFALDTVWHFFR
jgi:hypothetical protein